MFYPRFNERRLRQILIPAGRWHPYPTVDQRQAWARIRPDVRRALLALGRAARRAPWPSLPATGYLEFARCGDRARYEAPYFARRTALAHLVLAECLEGRGTFLDPIGNAVWSLCEESTWCLPAHMWMPKAGVGLPDIADPVVDLFAAETAALLAWTDYLLAGRMNDVSPQLRPRIRREVGVRLLDPCLRRDDFWWMGFGGAQINNWNPWINSNWLASALLLEADPRRRIGAVAKSLRSLDCFLDPYPRDGGCDEGPGYWTRAGASLFDCLETLRTATRGAIDLYAEPLIRNIGRYIYRAHISEDWFVNFADAPPRLDLPVALTFQFGQRIHDPALRALAASTLGRGVGLARVVREPLGRALPALATLKALAAAPRREPLPRDAWLPDIQVMLARSRAGTARGFTLAAKGGHNAESHNHNDVGQFVVYVDGAPVLIDVGVETYTRKTFGAQRYDIWTMQSQYHNLPAIDGIGQREGRAFQASDVRHAASATRSTLTLDLAPAYPPEAGLTSWVRRLTLERPAAVVIEDRYVMRRTPASLELFLMTPCPAAIRGGAIALGRRPLPGGRAAGKARIFFDARALRASVQTIRVRDPQLAKVWGPHLHRITLRLRAPGRSGVIALRVEP